MCIRSERHAFAKRAAPRRPRQGATAGWAGRGRRRRHQAHAICWIVIRLAVGARALRATRSAKERRECARRATREDGRRWCWRRRQGLRQQSPPPVGGARAACRCSAPLRLQSREAAEERSQPRADASLRLTRRGFVVFGPCHWVWRESHRPPPCGLPAQHSDGPRSSAAESHRESDRFPG